MNELPEQFMNRAESALESADLLYRNEQLLALANRTYYAVFYCVCALLATETVYTKKHQAARAKFGELFVNKGLFTREASRIVGNSFTARQSADYDMEADLSENEAAELLQDAKTFYDLTVAYLNKIT